MTVKIAHNSKEFFINGNMVNIRPLKDSDDIATSTYSGMLTDDSFVTLGQFKNPDNTTLFDYLLSDNGFVYLALSEDAGINNPQVIGLALYRKNSITLSHEMSLIITREYLQTRLPFELAETLIIDAAEHGVQTLYTKDDSTDNHMLNLARKMDMSVRLEKDTAGRTVVYSLQVDEHPAVVRF